MRWSSALLAAAGMAALVASGCGDPPSLVGGPCQTDDHCGAEDGLELVCDHAVPGGYCTLLGCALDDPQTCPSGSICVTAGEQTACRQACDTVLDCREVIACGPDPNCDPAQEKCSQVCDNAMACAPPSDPEDPDAPGTCRYQAP